MCIDICMDMCMDECREMCIGNSTKPSPAPIGPQVYTTQGFPCGAVRETTVLIARSCHNWRSLL